jgi:hypothetical protein
MKNFIVQAFAAVAKLLFVIFAKLFKKILKRLAT